jgi:hypothetical protein
MYLLKTNYGNLNYKIINNYVAIQTPLSYNNRMITLFILPLLIMAI